MPGGGPPARWTPRARRIAVTAFVALALVGAGVGVVGAVCEEPSLVCLRARMRDAVRILVVAVPLVAYGVYRITRGRGGPPPPPPG